MNIAHVLLRCTGVATAILLQIIVFWGFWLSREGDGVTTLVGSFRSVATVVEGSIPCARCGSTATTSHVYFHHSGNIPYCTICPPFEVMPFWNVRPEKVNAVTAIVALVFSVFLHLLAYAFGVALGLLPATIAYRITK